MENALNDTVVHALPDLTLTVKSDGTILNSIGGKELGGAQPQRCDTLARLWGEDMARHLLQLVRHALKSRVPLDRQFRHEGRQYELRLRPLGIERVLAVFRDLSGGEKLATAESSRSRLIESRSQLIRWLSLAAAESQIRERPLAVLTFYLAGLSEIERSYDVTVSEQLMRAALKRVRKLLPTELKRARGDGLCGPECLVPIGDQVLALVIENAPARGTLRAHVQRLREALIRPYEILNRSFELSCAIGVALAPEDGAEAKDLLNHARSAMFEAHYTDRGIAFHSDTLRLRALSRLDSEHELRWALENNQFQLEYRPLFAVDSGQKRALEVRPLWPHPVRKMVPAEEFLALAEKSELSCDLGRWLLNRSCDELAGSGAAGGKLSLVVGLGRRHMLSKTLCEDVTRALQTAELDARRLELKISERVLTAPGELLPRLQDLRELGVRIVVERFGSGYVALSRIAGLPVDGVSLDPQMLRDLDADERVRAVCRAAIDLAHAFGLQVSAENVSTQAQLDVLRELRCDLAGGELFGASAKLVPAAVA